MPCEGNPALMVKYSYLNCCVTIENILACMAESTRRTSSLPWTKHMWQIDVEAGYHDARLKAVPRALRD